MYISPALIHVPVMMSTTVRVVFAVQALGEHELCVFLCSNAIEMFTSKIFSLEL